MQLENQVANLVLAQKLKELGVKQESLFYWSSDLIGYSVQYKSYCEQTNGLNQPFFHAYTVAELGEMLPQYLLVGPYSHNLEIVRSSVWRFYYGRPEGLPLSDCVYFTAGTDDTEADARARFFIYLIENKFITI